MSAIFSLDQIMTVEEVKPGIKVFIGTALSKSSFVREEHITGLPHVVQLSKTLTGIFVNTENFKICLDDCNIVPNTYNKHKAFYTRESAQAYVDNCKLLNII